MSDNTTQFLEDSITIGVGISTNEKPFVNLTWGERTGQLTPDQARAHAFDLLAAAESAETDGFIWYWLTSEYSELNISEKANFLQAFRQYRDVYRMQENNLKELALLDEVDAELNLEKEQEVAQEKEDETKEKEDKASE